ncbi:MAG: tRNA (adenosine(37)-N6)-dimethylallyltransferase MiaA [Chloroflexota bacterium]
MRYPESDPEGATPLIASASAAFPEGTRTHSDQKPVVALIVGPTAVGKTEISLQLAERLGAEIVSVDSRLFYRGLDIGTAKPSRQDRARIPHHLIDIAEPDETLSLAAFQKLAHEAIAGIVSRARLPLLVGGTGQYARAVAAGWRPPRVPPNESLRRELARLASERGRQWLHERLRMLDPDAAAAIDPRNVRRTTRALEVILTTGRRFSQQRGHGDSPYRLIAIGLRRPRQELYTRIDARIDAMFAQGLLEETRRLLDRGFRPDLPALSAIGYLQCVKVIRGQLDFDQARAEVRRATRAFARRQSNWFKESDPHIKWFDAGQPGLVEAIESFTRGLASRGLQPGN